MLESTGPGAGTGPRPGSLTSQLRRWLRIGSDRRTRRRTAIRILQAGCVAAGIAVALNAHGSAIWIAPLWAVALPVFRAPDPDLLTMLRIRSHVRRIAGRIALLLATGGGLVSLHGANGWSRALVAGAAALMVVEPLLWRAGVAALPGDSGRRVRLLIADGRAVEKSVEVLRRPDVDVTVRATRSGGRQKTRDLTVRPNGKPTSGTSTLQREWLRHGAIAHRGGLLTVVGSDGVTHTWLVGHGGILPGFDAQDVAMSGARPGTSADATDVAVEIAVVVHSPWSGARLLLLLDAESRRLTEIPMFGFRERRILLLTQAAGIAFRTYQITSNGRSTFEEMGKALFPKSPNYRKVRGPRSEASERWRS